jgi:hypothetical protein
MSERKDAIRQLKDLPDEQRGLATKCLMLRVLGNAYECLHSHEVCI